MHRLFGKKKPEAPKPTLDDAGGSIEKRGEAIDQRVAKLDAELLKYKQQMSKMRDGPAKQQLQRRAINVLKQKKMYQGQRDTLFNQQFNIDQTKFATEGIKDTQTTIAAMKAARTDLRKGVKEMNIDEVEDLHDDMADLMEDTNEIQDILGRSYGVPEELDETDLMAELDGLEDELQDEELGTESEPPSYLKDAATTSVNQQQANTATTTPAVTSSASTSSALPSGFSSLPAAPSRQIQQPATSAPEQKHAVEVDEFGLPAPSNRRLV